MNSIIKDISVYRFFVISAKYYLREESSMRKIPSKINLFSEDKIVILDFKNWTISELGKEHGKTKLGFLIVCC